MGDAGSRRAALVSRLPIFRRSARRRRASPPRSPGPPGASPCSTSSSSGSAGRRRSLFRAPTLGFHPRRGGAKPDPASPTPPPPPPGAEEPGRAGPRPEKMTRWPTARSEREPPNKSVFTTCLSAGRSDGDDSGFTEEAPRRRAAPPARRSLPTPGSRDRDCLEHRPTPTAPPSGRPPDNPPAPGDPEPAALDSGARPPGSPSASPPLSADPTTAPTPSEFLVLTEDSVSEADAFPAPPWDHAAPRDAPAPTRPSPAAGTEAAPEPAGPAPGAPRQGGPGGAEPSAHQSQAAWPTPVGRPPAGPPGGGGSAQPPDGRAEGRAALRTSSPPRTVGLHDQHRAPAERPRGLHPVSDSGIMPAFGDHRVYSRASLGRDGGAAPALASSLSPCRQGRFMERRLRSSSEGTAGSSRTILKPKDGNVEEVSSLRKQRTGSSSSKMNSLDVLNHLGSCELDEDDLMLDLEFLEEQSLHPTVCREDSHHSVVSCAALVLTTAEPVVEKNRAEAEFPELPKQNLSLKLTKDVDLEARCPLVSRVPSSPSGDGPLRGAEESGGVDALPFRLMLQDCTAVKTLLLKMRRVLQESADMSPASSTTSLPVSPLAEEPVPFKDIAKDECSVLRLQLREKDELIARLQEELEKVQHLWKAFATRADKSTQTELLGCDGLNLKRLEAVAGGREATYRSRIVSQNLSTRDRKAIHTPTEDHFRHSAPGQTSPHRSQACQHSSLCLSDGLKERELAEAVRHSRGTREALASEAAQNLRTTGGQSSLRPAAKTEGTATFPEKPKERGAAARQGSTFTGRFGQPPRGPISLHMYSRENVFVHHNLHSTELQTLGQQDG
ncbi:serine-rich coiled-coil domain-containing protein 1 [Ctenodactylus gundi]